MSELSDPKNLTAFVTGWVWSEACKLTDAGVDIRRHEIPRILEGAIAAVDAYMASGK